MPLKIATWNINSVRLRIKTVERLIAEHDPDVLCLQEIKCTNDQFPAKAFAKYGYEHQAVHGQKAYHGVATVSKRPIRDIYRHDYCQMGDSRHVSVGLDVGGMAITVHNFYVPSGGDEPDPATNPKFDHKLKFVKEMRALRANSGDDDAVLVGDLNIAPHENDVWSHKQLLKIVSHTPVETEGLTRVFDEGGWVDLVRRHIPVDQKVYSWWSYRARDWSASDRGRRLDHVWSSPRVADQLASVTVLREARGWDKPSDHVPVIATLDLD